MRSCLHLLAQREDGHNWTRVGRGGADREQPQPRPQPLPQPQPQPQPPAGCAVASEVASEPPLCDCAWRASPGTGPGYVPFVRCSSHFST